MVEEADGRSATWTADVREYNNSSGTGSDGSSIGDNNSGDDSSDKSGGNNPAPFALRRPSRRRTRRIPAHPLIPSRATHKL